MSRAFKWRDFFSWKNVLKFILLIIVVVVPFAPTTVEQKKKEKRKGMNEVKKVKKVKKYIYVCTRERYNKKTTIIQF